MRKVLHIHCSGLLGDRAFNQWSSTEKMVFKRAFIGDTEKTLHVHSSGLQQDSFKSVEFFLEMGICTTLTTNILHQYLNQ